MSDNTIPTDDTFGRVKAIIVETLGLDDNVADTIVPDKAAEISFRESLGADSLDLVELIMAFEEAFDAEIADEIAKKIVTVEDAVNYLKSASKK
mgnify:CR=1 FL=1